jgi:hypothetical protein
MLCESAVQLTNQERFAKDKEQPDAYNPRDLSTTLPYSARWTVELVTEIVGGPGKHAHLLRLNALAR